MPIILVAVHLEYAVILVAMHLEYARHFGGSVPGICPSFWWQCTWNMPVILVAVHLEYARHFGGNAPGICPSFWWQCTWNMPSFSATGFKRLTLSCLSVLLICGDYLGV